MEDDLQITTLMAAAAAMILSHALPAPLEAQQRMGQRGGNPVTSRQLHRPQTSPDRHAKQHRAFRGAHIGQPGRHGRVWTHGPRYRLGPPPRGRHYRVIDNRVVQVDNSTLRILAIAGLLSELRR